MGTSSSKALSDRPKAARQKSRNPEPSGGETSTPSPILLVEDSKFIAKLVRKSLEKMQGCPVVLAHSMAEAKDAIDGSDTDFLAAVVDLDLPDAPDGEIVDLTTGRDIPTIVLTASYGDSTRERIVGKGIVDYHIKGDRSLGPLNQTLNRLRINPSEKILVVDDSNAYRGLIRRLLRTHRFDVVEACDGQHGLEVLEANPDTMLVITDYEMPNLDGIEFVTRLREKHNPDELAILGASSLGSSAMSAKFLKFGADDFITKPFLNEEFYCRVYHCIQMLENIREIKKAAYTDQLTGLFNRLYFFKKVPPLYKKAKENNELFSVAMIDIDFFKKINDTYGHAGGDVALKHLASILLNSLPKEMIVSRFGGEEFCIVSQEQDEGKVKNIFEDFRKIVESSPVMFEAKSIQFTLSIGATSNPDTSLDAMINRADDNLYMSKETGRNRLTYRD